MAKVTCSTSTLVGLLGDPKTLPEYQRAAAWPDYKNMLLLESILEWAKNPSSIGEGQRFYLGNLVTTANKKQIVDGQQRLNSLTIICGALRDVLIQLDRFALARDIQFKLIQRHTDGTLRYTPSHKRKESRTQKELEVVQKPLCSFPIGMKSDIAKDKGSNANKDKRFNHTYELNLDGECKWYLFKGDRLKVGDKDVLLEVAENIKLKEKGCARKVHGPSGANLNDLEGALNYSPNRDKGLNKKKSMHESYLKIGTRFYHLLNDMKFKTKFKKMTIKAGQADKFIQLRFEEVGGLGWKNPLPDQKEDVYELSDGTNQHKFETTRSSKAYTDFINIYLAPPTKEQKLVAMTYEQLRCPSFDNTKHAKTSLDLANHLVMILNETTFSSTNFADHSNALVHFTLANDGTRMEPLYNHDLLHALTISVIESLEDGDKSERAAAKKVRGYWEKIRNLTYTDHISDEIAFGLKYSDGFLGRFCLSKGWLDDKNKRYDWTKGKTDIYARIEKEMKKKSSYYDLRWKVDIQEFYENLLENAQYHELASNPLHDVAKKYLEPGARARILVIKKKSPEIFIPLIMSMLDRKLGKNKNTRSRNISDALDRVIYHLARFWVLPECCKENRDFVKISGQDFYGRYEKLDGWSYLIENAKSGKDFVDAVDLVEKEAVAAKVKKFADGKIGWPIPKKYHPVIASSINSQFLVYAHQLEITVPNQISKRLLAKKEYKNGDKTQGIDSDSSSHPQVEHIIPKDWKDGSKSKGSMKSWPGWSKKNHTDLVECIGNKTLLEYYINAHVSNHSLKFKVGDNCTVTGNTAKIGKHYGGSDYDQPKHVSGTKKWIPKDVEDRSVVMMDKICAAWK